MSRFAGFHATDIPVVGVVATLFTMRVNALPEKVAMTLTQVLSGIVALTAETTQAEPVYIPAII